MAKELSELRCKDCRRCRMVDDGIALCLSSLWPVDPDSPACIDIRQITQKREKDAVHNFAESNEA